MESKIILRKCKPSDKSNLVKLANNIKIWNNLRDAMPYPYKESDADFFINLTQNVKPQQHFGIESDGEFVGVISIEKQSDIYSKSAEIGYWIGEPFWGKGIATHAVRQIIKYGFENLEVERIYTGVFENNIASMKILKKNGFLEEGIFKKAIYKNEVFMDEYRFGILKK